MAVLFFDTDNAYEIIDRCQDLLPEWEKEGDQFWNRETGEIIRKDGSKYQDLVYRGYKYDLRHERDFGETSSNRSSVATLTGVDNWVLNSYDLDIDEYLHDNSAPEAVFV